LPINTQNNIAFELADKVGIEPLLARFYQGGVGVPAVRNHHRAANLIAFEPGYGHIYL